MLYERFESNAIVHKQVQIDDFMAELHDYVQEMR
jgi:hypothetical protein